MNLATAFPGVVDTPSSDPVVYARYWQFAALGFSDVYGPLGMFLHEDRKDLGLAMYLVLVPVFAFNWYLTGRSGIPPHVSAILSLVPLLVFALRDWWIGWHVRDAFPYRDRDEARGDFSIIDVPAVLSSGMLVGYIASHIEREALGLFYL